MKTTNFLQMNYTENRQGPELNFQQLPQMFEINEKMFDLSYVLHYIPGKFHFTSKFKLTNDAHLNIDDDGSVILVDNIELVNPKALVFVRKY